MHLEGYCKNGVHHIGEKDECWRCELWERQNTKRRLFHAALNAEEMVRQVERQRRQAENSLQVAREISRAWYQSQK